MCISLFLVSCSTIQDGYATAQSGYQIIMNTGLNVGIKEYDMRPDNYFNDPRAYVMWQNYYYAPYRDGKPHYFIDGGCNTDEATKKTDYHAMFTYKILW